MRPAPVAVAVAVAVVLVAGACSSAPSTEIDRSDPTPPPESSIVLTPTTGEVRTRVEGVGTVETPDDVLLVGDSVAALVADDLANRLSSTLHVDAVECRRLESTVVGPCAGVPSGVRVSSGIEAIADATAELDLDGIEPEVAVVVLANNSSLTEDSIEDAMDALGDIERVWWVNTRIVGFGRQEINNDLLDELARADDRIGIVDWFAASVDRPWLADHVHPNDAGQAALARLIVRQIRCDCTP